MADAIKAALGLDTKLISGDRGEFTVWVGDTVVVHKQGDDFPAPQEVITRIKGHLSPGASD